MKKFTDLVKERRLAKAKPTSAYSLNSLGPFIEDNIDVIPNCHGVYFGFKYEHDINDKIEFEKLIYVGRAIATNDLRARISYHYSQHDLHYRLTGNKVDMSTTAFFACSLDLSDDEISDIEAAEIFKQQHNANSVGIEHYIGKKDSLFISHANGFDGVDPRLYKNPVIIRATD